MANAQLHEHTQQLESNRNFPEVFRTLKKFGPP